MNIHDVTRLRHVHARFWPFETICETIRKPFETISSLAGNNHAGRITGFYPLCQSTQQQAVHPGTAFETTTDSPPLYEINLCGWAGTRTAIREGSEVEGGVADAVEMDTTGYLDANDYRQFWATAANGLVRIGTGNIIGFHTFISMQDQNDIQDIRYAGVATGWGSAGDWVVCIPERCTGIHDAVTARLHGMEVCDGCGHGCQGMCNPRDCAGGATACPDPTVNDIGHPSKYGFTGGGMVNPQDETGATMTFHLGACSAGPHALGFVYQLAPGDRGGLTNQRPMQLNVNGANVGEPISFAATGGWQAGDWREVFKQVQLTQGENIVVLSTLGQVGRRPSSCRVAALRSVGIPIAAC